jgi:hypothetical protein
MSGILRPGDGFLFMKVGTHAQESLEDIIKRKTKEIESAGFAFWGYGGGTCHPITMVQPFVRDFQKKGGIVYLCMQPMESRHFADQIRATTYSVDGLHWEQIPPSINVLGSRYALAIKELRTVEFELPLARTQVAIGNSEGRPGDKYIAGRVDKACLRVVSPLEDVVDGDPLVHIGLVATIIEPYAVFVKADEQT